VTEGDIRELGIPSSFSFFICKDQGYLFQLSVVRSGSVVLADGQLVLHSSSVRRHHYFSFDVQKNHSERRKQQVGRLDLAAEGYLIFFSGIDRMRKATDLCGVIFWTFF